jgi:hypothetical protein
VKKDDLKRLRKEELEQSAEEKAERFLAVKNNKEHQAWVNFFKRHTGTGAVNRNNGEDVFPMLEANINIIEKWLQQNNEQIDPEGNALERAFAACRERLVKYKPATDEEYERFTNSKESRIANQHVGSILKFPPPPPPFSRNQLIQMGETLEGRKTLQRAMKYYGAAALNKILATK